MGDDQRLERIENKLDQMGEAIVSLARMEERMVTEYGFERESEDWLIAWHLRSPKENVESGSKASKGTSD